MSKWITREYPVGGVPLTHAQHRRIEQIRGVERVGLEAARAAGVPPVTIDRAAIARAYGAEGDPVAEIADMIGYLKSKGAPVEALSKWFDGIAGKAPAPGGAPPAGDMEQRAQRAARLGLPEVRRGIYRDERDPNVVRRGPMSPAEARAFRAAREGGAR